MGKKRKNKYIPNLAEFYFKPDESLSVKEAKNLYNTSKNPNKSKIIYQDCIEGMKKLDTETVDLVIADPPFGIDFTGKESIYNRNKELVVDDYKEVIEDYEQFSVDWIKCLPPILKDTGSAYIISGYSNLESVLKGIRESGLELLNHIIWQYQFGVFTTRKFVSSHYHILFVAKKKSKYYFNRINHYLPDVWTDIKRTYKSGEKKNGTKLPIALIKRCIDYSSRPGDIVFDPFMGNGTTAVAAKMNYRHYAGFEMNTKMQEIIEHNLELAKLGELYTPYNELIPSPEQLLENNKEDSAYQRAYKIFLKAKIED
jgi:site-specific DNA-methyltransferase (adenine-specific)